MLAPEINKFYPMKKCRYGLHFDTQFLVLLSFTEFLETFLMKMVNILIMLAKVTFLGLLEIIFCLNKYYGIKISIHHVTNKILSCDSNYMRSGLSSSSITCAWHKVWP